jgi:hypothetical protein
MAHSNVRNRVAAVAASFGVAVLLAGPTSTFGLGVPVVGDTGATTTQVTSTVQGAVETTQQTVATVETTVQTTTQAVAPQPAAAPVQTTTQTVAAAPKQTVARVAAPVKQPAAAKPRTSSAPRTATAAPTQVASATDSVRAATRKVTTTTRAREVRKPTRLSTSSSTAGDDPSPCDQLLVLDAFPGAAQLRAVLTLVCNAGGSLLLPASLGGSHATADTPPSGEVRGISASGGTLRARSASTMPNALSGAASHPSAGAADASDAGRSLGTTAAPGIGRAGALGYMNAVNARPAATASGAVAGASATHGGHGGLFSGPVDGTQALLLLLFIDFVALLAIVFWRLGRRWALPRFA